MAAHLGPDALQLGKRMETIVRRSSGDYELTFRRANTTEKVIADAVLLTLPFAVLRELDYSKAGFDALKDKTIKELGRGRQSKQHLQFKQRIWNEKGSRPTPGTGTSYADTGYQVTWEASRAQPGTNGILVGYCGGAHAEAMSTKVAFATSKIATVQADAAKFLAQAEPVFNGLTEQWNGKSTQGIPHLDPNFKCSYSHWKTGQYTTIRGYEKVSQGRVFFAGEHTSLAFQGFMEGGAAEGQRAATEILASFGL
jgi:monoamine oxidase